MEDLIMKIKMEKKNNKKRRYYPKKKKSNKSPKEIEAKVVKKDTPLEIEELKRRLDKNYKPDFVKSIEENVRKGNILTSVKIFKENTGSPLATSKETVELYRESGNWDHWTFTKENYLELAFKKVCGATPDEYSKNQDKDVYDRAKEASTPIVSVNMALRIAVQYAQLLGKNSDI